MKERKKETRKNAYLSLGTVTAIFHINFMLHLMIVAIKLRKPRGKNTFMILVLKVLYNENEPS